jgi:hypothetical protein
MLDRRGHHDWPDKRVSRQSGFAAIRWSIPLGDLIAGHAPIAAASTTRRYARGVGERRQGACD